MAARLVPLIPWIGSLLALACAALALRSNARKRLIQSLPTSRADGVFMGLVELNGTAESTDPLHSHLAEVPCVHYTWKVEEEWRRTSVSLDSKGRPTTKTEQGWNTVASGTGTQPFYLRDSSGAVLVHPQGAKLEPAAFMEHTCRPDDPLYYSKGPVAAISNSTHQRRFSEHGFALHAPLFIIGKARERGDVVAAEIAHDDTAGIFLISSRSEEKIVSGYRWGSIVWSIAGLIVLLGMLVWWDTLQGRHWQSQGFTYGGAALGYAGAWALGWVWFVYNALVGLRNRVQHALSLVDIQLQRRHDLIPVLVRLVEALKDHEQRVQTQEAALRAQSGATLPGRSGPDPQALTPALAGLLEAYPELQSDQLFLDLQQQLLSTENRIALARDYFNSIATHYNTCLEQFPDRVVAGLAMMKGKPLLAAAGFERAAVQVQFAR